jgi:polyhydroxyalkanoate synthase subunit PhaC
MMSTPNLPSAASTGTTTDERQLRRNLCAQLATVTGGIAPDDYITAWWDWYLNLTKDPDKSSALSAAALQGALDTWQFALQASSGAPLPPSSNDARFAGTPWSQWPFNIYTRAYQNWASWWQRAVTDVPGVADRNAKLMGFAGSQLLEAASPSNYLHTNPELLETTRAESGQNLVRGFKHWVDDLQRTLDRSAPAGSEHFKVGEQVAVTPGKVVLRNRLIELIQYTPQTPGVYAEPILITPAWIMKYYILDLSPVNSLVRYLVAQGHTVFMISWKNPNEADRDLGMDDYLELGLRAALAAVGAIVPNCKIHTVGYCIGGTLLAIGAAALARENDQRIASLTTLAAQTDFSDPGELSLFISPSQLEMLEAVMHKQGVLASDKMAGSFMLLRSRDLLWAPAVNKYLRGKLDKPNDLMAWNADGTRMPWRMHTEYLYRLFLHNELARGEFPVAGAPIHLQSITVPLFVVGTETDHVAPWRSVYKMRGLTRSTDYTFLLTSGGHNAGIVSGPVHPRRRHRLITWNDATTVLDPEQWLEEAELRATSWWPSWQHWLRAHSSKSQVAPPAMGAPAQGYAALADAPGDYVREK